MKNITLSAKEEAIERAREVASQKHRTLNDLFREWLDNLGTQLSSDDTATRLGKLWEQTSYTRVGKKLTRNEMNER